MKWIKKIRTENGLTQEEFANKLSFSRALIAKWETGERHPNASQIKYICKLFDIELDKYIMKDGFKELLDKQKSKVRKSQILTIFLFLISCGILTWAFIDLPRCDSMSVKILNSISFIFSGMALFATSLIIKSDIKLMKDDKALKVLILKEHMTKEEIEAFNWSDNTEINIRLNNLIE